MEGLLLIPMTYKNIFSFINWVGYHTFLYGETNTKKTYYTAQFIEYLIEVQNIDTLEADTPECDDAESLATVYEADDLRAIFPSRYDSIVALNRTYDGGEHGH